MASDLWADAPATAPALRPFLETHCLLCHDGRIKKGGLDLEQLSADWNKAAIFDVWVKVHDKIASGAMPPPKRKRPSKKETNAVVHQLGEHLRAAERRRKQGQGRSMLRRFNRTEYENTLRDLLDLPGLSIRDLLPEDGRAHGFDKCGTALDVSHVQLARYLEVADVALDLAIAPYAERPALFKERLYPGAQYDFKIVLLNGDAVFLKNQKYDRDSGIPVLRGRAPKSMRQCEQEGLFPYKGSVGVLRHEDCAFVPRFNAFAAIHPGRYKLRLSVWGFQWDKGEVKPAARTEAARLSVNGRLIGYFDAPSLTPTIHETEVWLNRGEYVVFNAASLWPVRVSERKGRAAEYVGPGVALDWLDIEGPLHEDWPDISHRRLFGALPLGPLPKNDIRPPQRERPRQLRPDGRNGAGKYTFATVVSDNPEADAERLLDDFLRRAFRRPVTADEIRRYVDLVRQRLAAKVSFEEAMRTAYKAALNSTNFLFLRETPGRLDDWALASRLSYFLWNSLPDDELFHLAEKGQLHEPKVLHAQVERMLADSRAERFVADFLDQWLDLRDLDMTTPDRRLYPEFIPYLRDSMRGETQAFFRELLHEDLGAANIVDSNFAMLNQKIAEHYGIAGVSGTAFRRVALPPGSHRGGILTQASVLKVTANGTTTSPVKRGVWVQSKVVGRPPEPPPPDLPAIEPDVRGAVTIREQLAKHRSSASCNACHAHIDPPGFALESFDVIGGWRQRYRSLEKGDPVEKSETGGHTVRYRHGPPVDCAGRTIEGRAFDDIEQFKKILLENQRQIARNLVEQLLVYATGTPVGFSDRAIVELILDRTAKRHYGVRSLIHEIVQSPLFVSK